MKRATVSKDHTMVEINLESNGNKSVGLDFVTGDSRNYLASQNRGLRISVKSARSANPDILTKILKTVFTDIMGEKPTIMPPTHLTRIIMVETNQPKTGLSEEEILEGLAQNWVTW